MRWVDVGKADDTMVAAMCKEPTTVVQRLREMSEEFGVGTKLGLRQESAF